jgi:hypothetical protein
MEQQLLYLKEEALQLQAKLSPANVAEEITQEILKNKPKVNLGENSTFTIVFRTTKDTIKNVRDCNYVELKAELNKRLPINVLQIFAVGDGLIEIVYRLS